MDGEVGGATRLRGFPTGGGEMGAMMRQLDWSGSKLGSPASWPQPLLTIVDLMANSRYPMFVAWGPDLSFIYNDAYAPILGRKHPAALGRPFAEVWPEIWSDIEPLVQHVLAGESTWSEDLHLIMERNGFPEDTYYTFSYSPVRAESGEVAGVFCACTETTLQVEARQRTQFLLEIDDKLRDLAEPSEILETVSRSLGLRLRAVRAGYCGIDEGTGTLSVEVDWTGGGAPSLQGAIGALNSFGSIADELRGGRTVVLPDLLDDSLSAIQRRTLAWGNTETRSLIMVPLLKSGSLVAILYVHDDVPRRWTGLEITLVEDTAEKTWVVHEKAFAEAALKRQLQGESERLRDLLQQAPGFMAIMRGPAHIFEMNNAAFERLVGRSNLLGRPVAEAVPEIATQGITEILDEVMRTGEPFMGRRLPIWLQRFPGSPEEERFVDMTYQPIRDPEGRISGVFLQGHDVTDAKRAEDKLRESENRFRTMADSAPVLIWVADNDGNCTFLNRSWYEFTGQDPGEALGSGWLDALHPDDREAALDAFARGKESLSRYQVEYRIWHREGRYRWMIDVAAPRFDSHGNYLGYIGSVIDNSGRKEIEQALRQREHELQVITDAVPMLISQIDANGRYHFANQAYGEWYGFSPEDLIGRTIEEVLGEEGYAIRAEHIEKALSGQAVTFDSQVTLKDGSRRSVETRYIPNLTTAGVPDGFFAVVIDITGRKQALEERELLMAELQHRIKNVLAVVKALAAQSFKASKTKEQAADALNARIQALSSAHDLITQSSWTRAPVATVLKAALAPHDASFARFRLSGPDVEIDPKRALTLALATHELATNALKYGAASNDHGHVEITWEVAEDKTGPLFLWLWQEVDGPAVTEPQREGFGTRLIKRVLAADFNGSVALDYAANGLRCELRAPLHRPSAD